MPLTVMGSIITSTIRKEAICIIQLQVIIRMSILMLIKTKVITVISSASQLMLLVVSISFQRDKQLLSTNRVL